MALTAAWFQNTECCCLNQTKGKQHTTSLSFSFGFSLGSVTSKMTNKASINSASKLPHPSNKNNKQQSTLDVAAKSGQHLASSSNSTSSLLHHKPQAEVKGTATLAPAVVTQKGQTHQANKANKATQDTKVTQTANTSKASKAATPDHEHIFHTIDASEQSIDARDREREIHLAMLIAYAQKDQQAHEHNLDVNDERYFPLTQHTNNIDGLLAPYISQLSAVYGHNFNFAHTYSHTHEHQYEHHQLLDHEHSIFAHTAKASHAAHGAHGAHSVHDSHGMHGSHVTHAEKAEPTVSRRDIGHVANDELKHHHAEPQSHDEHAEKKRKPHRKHLIKSKSNDSLVPTIKTCLEGHTSPDDVRKLLRRYVPQDLAHGSVRGHHITSTQKDAAAVTSAVQAHKQAKEQHQQKILQAINESKGDISVLQGVLPVDLHDHSRKAHKAQQAGNGSRASSSVSLATDPAYSLLSPSEMPDTSATTAANIAGTAAAANSSVETATDLNTMAQQQQHEFENISLQHDRARRHTSAPEENSTMQAQVSFDRTVTLPGFAIYKANKRALFLDQHSVELLDFDPKYCHKWIPLRLLLKHLGREIAHTIIWHLRTLHDVSTVPANICGECHLGYSYEDQLNGRCPHVQKHQHNHGHNHSHGNSQLHECKAENETVLMPAEIAMAPTPKDGILVNAAGAIQESEFENLTPAHQELAKLKPTVQASPMPNPNKAMVQQAPQYAMTFTNYDYTVAHYKTRLWDLAHTTIKAKELTDDDIDGTATQANFNAHKGSNARPVCPIADTRASRLEGDDPSPLIKSAVGFARTGSTNKFRAIEGVLPAQTTAQGLGLGQRQGQGQGQSKYQDQGQKVTRKATVSPSYAAISRASQSRDDKGFRTVVGIKEPMLPMSADSDDVGLFHQEPEEGRDRTTFAILFKKGRLAGTKLYIKLNAFFDSSHRMSHASITFTKVASKLFELMPHMVVDSASFDWLIPTDECLYGRNYYTILGYKNNDPCIPYHHKQWQKSVVHPDDLATFKNEYLVVKDRSLGDSFELLYRSKCRDGSYIWTKNIGTVVARDHQGRATRVLGINIDINRVLEGYELLQNKVFTDILTGLRNRTYLITHMESFIQAADKPLTVIFTDITALKIYNDYLGHTVGDKLLCSAAILIKSAINRVCELIRISGDEIICLLPDCNEQESDIVQKQLNEALVQYNINAPVRMPVFFSIGAKTIDLSQYAGRDLNEKEKDEAFGIFYQAIQDADLIMQQNKRLARTKHYSLVKAYVEKSINRTIELTDNRLF